MSDDFTFDFSEPSSTPSYPTPAYPNANTNPNTSTSSHYYNPAHYSGSAPGSGGSGSGSGGGFGGGSYAPYNPNAFGGNGNGNSGSSGFGSAFEAWNAPIPGPQTPQPTPQPQPQFQQQPQNQWFNPGSDPLKGIDIVQGIKIYNDPSILTQGVQNQGQKFLHFIQPYFNVKKSYVQSKLKMILFPYFHKTWHRVEDLRFRDVNAPDLYIPLMAFVTYVLLVGFFMGTKFRFTPDVLGATSSTAIGLVFLEVILLKTLFFFLNFPKPISILELLSYNGYKFVSITINIISGILFGNTGFYVAFLLTSLSIAIFTTKSLNGYLLNPMEPTNPLFAMLLFGVGALQVLSSFFLCYLDFNMMT
eukprot:TRINITY_DN6028_c0_g1_i1.p1 TRINITY_DN6028_c0_g1~~TRINITY_DN6028_c0_g1_i1.p1  ORF type:complete len:360 (-),score=61.92 TRINITY_DN6028_c0_g1_i1:922-2001(-)